MKYKADLIRIEKINTRVRFFDKLFGSLEPDDARRPKAFRCLKLHISERIAFWQKHPEYMVRK